MLVVSKEKGVSLHESEISLSSIPIQERKEEAISKSRKCKEELKDLWAGVKYHKIYHTRKAKTEDEGETILLWKELD